MKKRQKASQSADQPVQPAPAGLLTVMGAAAWLGVSRATLFELMHERDFPVIRISGKVVRFDPNSLYAWALKRQTSGRYIAS